MKKKLVILTISLCALLLILNNYVTAQTTKRLTQEQIEAFRSAKKARILVEQSYGIAKDVNLPFEDVARRFLEKIGIKVVDANDSSYNVTLTIHAWGKPLVSHDQSGVLHYAGASVSGSISLEIKGIPAYKKAFNGRATPGRIIEKVYPTPSSAPFFKALDLDYSFVEQILLMMGEVYGPNSIIPILKERGKTRYHAVGALEAIGKKAVEPLIAALKDKDRKFRRYVAEALGKIKDPRAVEPLIATLRRDKDSLVRRDAARALGRIKDPRAVEPLIYALKDKKESVRLFAAKALGKIKDPRAVEPLIAALKDKNERVRWSAAEVLGRIKDPRAVEPLIYDLKDKDNVVRYVAAEALGKIKDPRAVKPLIATLRKDMRGLPFFLDAKVRWHAAEALGRIKDPRVVEPLIAALKDENQSVRWRAAEALGKIKDPRAVEPLIAALKEMSAEGALKNLTGKNFGKDQGKWQEWWEENKDKFLKKKLEPKMTVTHRGESEAVDLYLNVGNLTVFSAPIRCVIYFQGKKINKAKEKVEFGKVPVGSHQILFERGGKTLTYTVKIEKGKTREIKVDFLAGKVIDIIEERGIAVGARVNLRSSAQILSENDVKDMLWRKGFFNSRWNRLGDFPNDFESREIAGDRVVLDHATGLMWHQSGPEEHIRYDNVGEWVERLNIRGYAGYSDWRLPTLEEAASLLESREMNEDLYIDPKFSAKQSFIWTSDMISGKGLAWIVNFREGDLGGYDLIAVGSIRPVRSGR